MNKAPVIFKEDIFWAFLDKINDDSEKYQVDLCNLSDNVVTALESMGIAVKNNPKKPEQGNYITCKSKNPIRAEHPNGEEIKALVANKSKCKAMVSAYEWKYLNKSGISPTLMKLTITDLKEYNPDGAVTNVIDLTEDEF
jgi:hypothetical protein